MKHRKLLTAIICLALTGILVVSGTAVVKYKFRASSGETVSETINRVNITVSATEFTFASPDKNGMLECRATVSIEKTEPDFYGKLNSITLSGAEFGYVMYTAGKDNGNAHLPENVLLPSDTASTQPLVWEIAFTVPYEEGRNEYEVSLDIDYTTGVKTNLAQKYYKGIPIKITVDE